MRDGSAARLRAGAVIALGLLLALAATLGPLPSPGAEPGASVAVRLPDAVRTLVLALLASSALLLLLGLQRPRRPADDEPLGARTPPRRPLWEAALLLLPLLVSLAAVGYLVWYRWTDGHSPIETAFTAIAELLEALARARKPPTSVPFFDLTIAGLVLALALATFLLMLLIALADRLEKWLARRRDGDAAPAIPATVSEDDGDPRAESDPRRAIVRAYRRFERVLSAARLPRAPWQTPAEFMRTTTARLPASVTSVARLTELFELARFSDRPLSAAARDAACDCLDDITTAVSRETARDG